MDVDGAAAEPRGDRKDEEDGDDDEEEMIEINLAQSLFDSHVEEDVHSALDYMRRSYGFYIPEAEFIEDMDELLEYLHSKVKIGCCCLFCNRTFRSSQACQQHMIDKSHCKIKYDEQADFDELSDFYDFSSTYPTAAGGSGGSGGGGGGAAEDGEQWGDAEADDAEDEDGDMPKSVARVEMLPSGEMLVTREDGTTRRLGVRWLKRYYAQNARVIDERAAVVSARRERLLQLYKSAGVETTEADLMLLQNPRAGAAGESRAIAKARRSEKQFVGHQLTQARKHFYAEHKKSMKMGMQTNWLQKNLYARRRSRGEGVGVHG